MENKNIKPYGIQRLLELIKTNYPKLFTLYNEQEIKEILDNNIKEVITNWYSNMSSGQYNFLEKKIYVSKNNEDAPEINIDDMLKNQEYEYSFMHEILHALWGILEEKDGNIKFTESTFIFEIYKNDEDASEIGRGFTEGLKEWLLSKLYLTNIFESNSRIETIKTVSHSYPIETNVALQIECVVGEDKMLNICKNGIAEFRNIFSTDAKSIEFLSKIDEVYYFNRNIKELEDLMTLMEDVWLDNNEGINKEDIYQYYEFLGEQNIDLDNLDMHIGDTEELLADEIFNLNESINQIQEMIDELVLNKHRNEDLKIDARMYDKIRRLRLVQKTKKNKLDINSYEGELSK